MVNFHSLTHIMGILTVFSFVLFVYTVASQECTPRDYGNGGTVCVCTRSKCDSIPTLQRRKNQYQLYTSSLSGQRFAKKSGAFLRNSTSSKNNIAVNEDETYQDIVGFGGAFTDSTGINMLSLSNDTMHNLMRSYYSQDGIQYSLGRVPIAGTDFSTRGYTYDDVDDDFELKFFSLQVEDYSYKIPFINYANALTEGELRLFASAWTAPAWMKTNGNLIGIGFLNQSMFEPWANYYIRFFDEYMKNNITFWGLTTGNEPANGYSEFMHINDMGWSTEMQSQWIGQFLGPKLRLNPHYQDMKIMAVDDQRVYFPWIPRLIMQNDLAATYIDGFAVHYYTDLYVAAEVLSLTHFDYPDKFILATEGCEGSSAQQSVILGSWDRAENYLKSIIDDLNNWSTGWMDWNMALNLEGGPTYVSNYVDSPIIVNKTGDEFYKQPMYYALGHFSKFLRPGSKRVQSSCSVSDLKQVVFKRPDGGIVVSVFNPTDTAVTITVNDKHRNQVAEVDIIPRSINSLIYW